MELCDFTAVQLGKKIQQGEVSSAEAVREVLKRIHEREDLLHCYVTIDEEGALQQAEEVQKQVRQGRLHGPLAGAPVALKDNLCTRGMRTTCGSKMLASFVPSYSAFAVRQLKKSGAVILGKTNMDEFAMGSTTETSAFGVTKNPWGIEHVPGGSSGGSCAAVAAEECFYALGSDTGGSIRQPSSFCGVTGLKPTYGTVSRYGLVAYASSMDQIGPIAKDVTDCAAILEAIAGYDEKDSTSVKRKDLNFTKCLDQGVKGLRIGILRDYFEIEKHSVISDTVLHAARVLEGQGAVIEEVKLDLAEYAVPAYYVIASAEASSNLARFDGVKYGYRAEDYEGLSSMYEKTRSDGFGAEAKRRIMLGAFVLSSGYYDAYYRKALCTKALIKREFDRVFASYDVLLGPAAPNTAPRLAESLKDPIRMYQGDLCTVSANLAGLPGISVPCGTDQQGLPIGMQLLSDCFQETKLLRAAYAFEKTRAYEKPRVVLQPDRNAERGSGSLQKGR